MPMPFGNQETPQHSRWPIDSAQAGIHGLTTAETTGPEMSTDPIRHATLLQNDSGV
jgi:hypothetical protein